MTRRLVLTEYIPSDPVSLSVTERELLRDAVPGLEIRPARGETTSYTLTNGSSVRIVRIRDLTVELRPKVGVAPLLFMISHALDPRSWRDVRLSTATDSTLAEALVPLFAEFVQRALRPGLLHGYRWHEETLPTIRGRVRMADQMRKRLGLPMPIEVAYDDFTPDILENQLLRSAIDRLGRLRLRDHRSRRLLTGLHQQLNGITPLTVKGNPVPMPTWTRLDERYRPAVELAGVILANRGLEARHGEGEAKALVVDMNAVFERFVRAALAEQLRLNEIAFPAPSGARRLYLDTGGFVPLQPDLTWWSHGKCLFVGDCKYKRTSGSIPNADIYQMLAYLVALDLPEGLLVYAAGESATRDLTIDKAGKRIHVRTLDIAQPPSLVLAEVRELADLVRQLNLAVAPSTRYLTRPRTRPLGQSIAVAGDAEPSPSRAVGCGDVDPGLDAVDERPMLLECALSRRIRPTGTPFMSAAGARHVQIQAVPCAQELNARRTSSSATMPVWRTYWPLTRSITPARSAFPARAHKADATPAMNPPSSR